MSTKDPCGCSIRFGRSNTTRTFMKILYAVPTEILRFFEIFCHTTRQRISSEYGAFRPGSADIPTGCGKLASHEYYYGMAHALPTRNGNVQTELKSTVPVDFAHAACTV